MNKKEIISKVLSEEKSFSEKSSEELETMIDEELSKPDSKIDFGLIDELTLQAIEEKGRKPLSDDVEEKLKELKAIQRRDKKFFRLPRWSIGLVAACIMILCVNVFTVSAWNMNVFSLVVELTQGGVKIDFSNQETNQKEEIVLPTSEDDPYGIIAVCEDMGIYIETPHYLPDDFILTNLETETNDYADYVGMTYTNGDEIISLTYSNNHNGISQIGIPSDEHNISEITINGHTAIMSREDNQMIVIFTSENVISNVFTENVDYDECDKIIESIR